MILFCWFPDSKNTNTFVYNFIKSLFSFSFIFMPKFVIKKDGRKEEFIPEKIVVAAIKSGATPEIARNIAKKVEAIDKEEIESKEIREIVLHELESVNPKWQERWLSYDKQIKRLYKHYKNGLYE